MKLCRGVSESGHERATWGDLSDDQINTLETQLTTLRAEKTGLAEDLKDYKDSIQRGERQEDLDYIRNSFGNRFGIKRVDPKYMLGILSENHCDGRRHVGAAHDTAGIC